MQKPSRKSSGTPWLEGEDNGPGLPNNGLTTSTDADAVYLSRRGVATGLVSVPLFVVLGVWVAGDAVAQLMSEAAGDLAEQP